MSYLILIETINYLQLIITSGLIQWNLLTDVKQKKRKWKTKIYSQRFIHFVYTYRP